MEDTFNFQFYPTPAHLARKAWAKFQNREFVRVLEPSAGNGDLIKGMPQFGGRHDRVVSVDCCEIDISKHATLRSLPGVNVVGMDFLQFGGGTIYSHIVQNPPFAQGVHHVLKAWDAMFDGEIVSIINAETVRNQNSRERQFLGKLIEQHGSVEFIEEAFCADESERKTKVEIALVYLRKQSHTGESIVSKLLEDLQVECEKVRAERLAQGYEELHELSVPTTVIENAVVTFNAAVMTMRESVVAEARANHYARMIGQTMADISSGSCTSAAAHVSIVWVQNQIAERYLVLKDKSWAHLLRSSNVTSMLSSRAQKRVESEFETIRKLEFSEANIFGFLQGLMESQGEIRMQMACDVFELITRFHTDNLTFYKSWKSNDKHRSAGMRLKTTRFVIPGNMNFAGSSNLSWDAECRLRDIDKVMALLDGKQTPDVSLVEVFSKSMTQLKGGERVTSSYMDVRFYPKAGTIHFFPRNKAIMDKLNKMVGEHHRWLPPVNKTAPDNFWKQYSESEKFDKELRSELDARQMAKRSAGRHVSDWDHPLRGVFQADSAEQCASEIDAAMTTVLERNGISVDFQLQQSPSEVGQGQLLLAA